MKSRSLVYNRATGEMEEVLTEVTPEQLAADAAADAEVQAELAAEETARTVGAALDSALAVNLSALSMLTTWRTSGPGVGTANLTAAQLSAALRQMADNQVAQFRQLNGLIRLLRRKLDSAEGATLKTNGSASAI